MSKRKQTTTNSDSDSDTDIGPTTIDVDFEFFDPNPAIDYHALLRLLRQLFQSDAEAHALGLHGLTELVLGQPLVGTGIKTDGRESDPLAFLTVLNLGVHRDHPSIASLLTYLLHKSSPNAALHGAVQSLIGPNALPEKQGAVGLVVSERLINMPVQVVPPMYKMLENEIRWAVEDGEPYTFTHLIFVSRTYHLTPEEEAAISTQGANAAHPAKRQKGPSSNTGANERPVDGVYSFHPEDEVILKFSTHTHAYPLSAAQEPRDKDAFGLDMGGRMMLVPAERFGELVEQLAEVFGVSGAPS